MIIKKHEIKVLSFAVIFNILSSADAFASAWTRQEGEFFGLFEILDESSSSKTLFSNNKSNFYRNNAYKFYFEYGLFNKFTIGGYLKNYNFYSKGTFGDHILRKKVSNDYYGNIFLIQNLYNKNSNVFSLQYSYYFPIKYNDLSKNVNTVDTKNSFEFGILFGNSNNFILNDTYVEYFLDTSLNYKMVSGIDYDQITAAATVGFSLNSSSTFSFHYEYQYFLEDNLFDKNRTIYAYYEANNTNKVEIAFTYRFFDKLSTELAFYRNFSKTNSNGITFSFIFA